MNKILIGAILVAVTSTTALAADLPSRRAPPVFAPPIVPPAFSWTGLYFGGTAGYAFDGEGQNTFIANTAAQQNGVNVGNRPGFLNNRSSGFTGGGTIGYNFQLGGGFPLFSGLGNAFSSGLGPILGNGGATGGFVAGLEADAAYTNLEGGTNFIGANGSSTFVHNDTQFVGTVRGRLGYAFGDLLIFGTGGFAYGEVKNTALLFPGVAGYAGATSSLRTGYAYGGGVEYAIPTTSFLNFFKSSAVTVKAEFIHFDLGNQTAELGNTFGGNGTPQGLSRPHRGQPGPRRPELQDRLQPGAGPGRRPLLMRTGAAAQPRAARHPRERRSDRLEMI